MVHLIPKFEKELYRKIDLKINSKLTHEKYLNDQFKFYNIQNNLLTDLKLFKRCLIKIGIMDFTEKEIEDIFNYYLNIFKESINIDYKSLSRYLFTKKIMKKENELEKKDIDNDKKSLVESQNDKINEETIILNIIEIFLHKLRNSSLDLIFKILIDFQNTSYNNGFINLNNFKTILNKYGFNISKNELVKLFDYLKSSNEYFIKLVDKTENNYYEKLNYHLYANYFFFIDLLVNNFNEDRNKFSIKLFSKFDYSNNGFINLNLFLKLFNPRNYPYVKDGRKTIDEINKEFNDLINIFIKYESLKSNNNSTIVDDKIFLFLIKFISISIIRDSDFLKFCENCFKFNELPRKNNPSFKNLKNEELNKIDDNISIKSSYNSLKFDILPNNNMNDNLNTNIINNLINNIKIQLSKKGNKGIIYLYNSFKCNDHDNDNFIYKNELIKALNESRIRLSEKDIHIIFSNFSNNKHLFSYKSFIDSLIPNKNNNIEKILSKTFNELTNNNQLKEIPFQVIEACFYPRGHPDFKNGNKADYEIKNEFFDLLKTFLITHKNDLNKIDYISFNTFFRMLALNWEENYFESIVKGLFKIKKNFIFDKYDNLSSKEYTIKNSSIKTDNIPYGVDSHYENSPQKLIKNKNELDDLNNEIKNSLFKKKKLNDRNSSNKKRRIEINKIKPFDKLKINISKNNNFINLIALEYNLSNKTQNEIHLDLKSFKEEIKNNKYDEDLKENDLNEIFNENIEVENFINIQEFFDKIRGQLNEKRESLVVELFNKISTRKKNSLSIDTLRKIISGNYFCKFFKFTDNENDILEEWNYFIDLYCCLNLKDKNDIDIDAFLYLFDNMSFIISDDNEFENLVKFGFNS